MPCAVVLDALHAHCAISCHGGMGIPFSVHTENRPNMSTSSNIFEYLLTNVGVHFTSPS